MKKDFDIFYRDQRRIESASPLYLAHGIYRRLALQLFIKYKVSPCLTQTGTEGAVAMLSSHYSSICQLTTYILLKIFSGGISQQTTYMKNNLFYNYHMFN